MHKSERVALHVGGQRLEILVGVGEQRTYERVPPRPKNVADDPKPTSARLSKIAPVPEMLANIRLWRPMTQRMFLQMPHARMQTVRA